ncbi:hypothetical protein pdam_00018914, partial [Pocillopora damicornis]
MAYAPPCEELLPPSQMENLPCKQCTECVSRRKMFRSLSDDFSWKLTSFNQRGSCGMSVVTEILSKWLVERRLHPGKQRANSQSLLGFELRKDT